MKAIICTKYGPPDVLRPVEVEMPVPGENEIRVQIHAASATTADCMMRRGTPFYARFFLGLSRPKHPIPGTGFAGVVEATGAKVERFKAGDRVFGETGVSFGAYAEYVCVPEDGAVTTLPDGMTFEEAAPLCDGALTSLSFLKDIGQLQQGQKVLINAASGSLGSAAVQLAKAFGAEATGVCSTANVDLVTSLGADRVIDYTKEDFTRTGHTYDVIFDTIGKSSFSHCKRALTSKGVYLSPVLKMPLLLQMLRTSAGSGKKAKFSATGMRPAAELRPLLDQLKRLIEARKLKMIIDQRYSLEQAAEAHRYIETGHKKGNVVLLVAQSGQS